MREDIQFLVLEIALVRLHKTKSIPAPLISNGLQSLGKSKYLYRPRSGHHGGMRYRIAFGLHLGIGELRRCSLQQ